MRPRLRWPARWRRRSRIAAPRDTDADWQRIGAEEPYFGVLTDARFLSANLDAAARADFFSSGETDVADQLSALRERFGAFAPRSALDFGCGVGRLTRPLAALTGDAVGVDVSEGMLAEARRHPLPGLDYRATLPDRTFDLVLSIIVFQHIEPRRGYALLRALAERLAPGGRIALHVTVWRDHEHDGAPGGRFRLDEGFTPLHSAHATPPGTMAMFDYDLSIVAAILFGADIAELAAVHTDHGGHHGVMLYGCRREARGAAW